MHRLLLAEGLWLLWMVGLLGPGLLILWRGR
jgi:hypothetical protein